MKEEITIKLMEKILQYANNTEAFLNEEVPIYIKEILEFNFYNELFYLIGSLVIILVSVYVVKRNIPLMIKYEEEDNNTKTTYHGVISLLFGVIGVLYVLILFINGYNSIETMIKIKTAPRVYIVEYITNNLNKK